MRKRMSMRTRMGCSVIGQSEIALIFNKPTQKCKSEVYNADAFGRMPPRMRMQRERERETWVRNVRNYAINEDEGTHTNTHKIAHTLYHVKGKCSGFMRVRGLSQLLPIHLHWVSVFKNISYFYYLYNYVFTPETRKINPINASAQIKHLIFVN